MLIKEAVEYINWANGEPSTMNYATTTLRKAVRALKKSEHLLSDYNANLLRITAKHLRIPLLFQIFLLSMS